MPSGDSILLYGLLLAASAILFLAFFAGNTIRLFFVKGALPLKQLLLEFQHTIDQAEQSLLLLPDRQVETRPEDGKWSKKEILGHLIDSASNNHQRFVRAQLSSEIKLPAYDQKGWVNTQKYQDESWPALVRFWTSYNRHLFHVIRSMPAKSLQGRCFIGDNLPVTLEELIRDYVEHLKHHLKQILETKKNEER